MSRAFVIGLCILIGVHALYLLLLQSANSFASLGSASFINVTGVVLWVAPLAAAFVVAMLAPHRRLSLAISLAVPAAVLFGLTNLIFEALGNSSDFPGVMGAAMVVGMSAPVVLVLCTLGGVTGRWLRSRRGA